MQFVELPPFPKRLKKLKGERSFNKLKDSLFKDPKMGFLVRGTEGCRKIRLQLKEGKGKSGGGRVIYYYEDDEERIYFILIYAKSDQENLSGEDKRRLKLIVERIKQ